MARFASVQPRDLQLLHGAAHRIPEINFDLILEVAAGFLLRLYSPAASAATPKKLAEQIAEAARPRAFPSGAAKIKPAKVEIHRGIVIASALWRRSPGIEIVAIESVLVIHLPLLRIRKDVVRFLQLLEFFFGGFVPRIQIRVIFARQFAKSSANVLCARFAGNAQQFVIILFGSGGHLQPKKFAGAHRSQETRSAPLPVLLLSSDACSRRRQRIPRRSHRPVSSVVASCRPVQIRYRRLLQPRPLLPAPLPPPGWTCTAPPQPCAVRARCSR